MRLIHLISLGMVVNLWRVEAAEAPVHGEVGGAALVLGDL